MVVRKSNPHHVTVLGADGLQVGLLMCNVAQGFSPS